MVARRYIQSLLPCLPGQAAPFAGAALHFTDPATGRAARVFADPGLRRTLANPVRAAADGAFPEIFIESGHPCHVALNAGRGSVVASELLAAGASSLAAPDDAGLFGEIARLTVPAAVTRLRTEGWSRIGLGAGDYVSDALASRELAARHPRFCAVTANGRAFRLAAANGLITVEQAGAVGNRDGAHLIDDREAFQAAIDYAAAIGIERIGLAQPGYSIWCPARRSGYGGKLRETDGHSLVVAARQRVHFIGLTPARARLSFRAPGGHSYQGVQPGRAFALVEGKVWRGSGFYVMGGGRIDRSGKPDTAPRGSLTLEHLVADGGTRQSGSYMIPARPTDGAGWDVTHKGIWMEADRRGADIVIRDCELTGWRGETVYGSNDHGAKLTVRSASFTHSNGQGLNLNACLVDIDQCRIEACQIGIEGWTGARGGRIVRTEIVECYGEYGRYGRALSLQGGVYGTSPRSAYYAPARALPGDDPAGIIDITCRHCSSANVGWWLKGRLVLVDTRLILGAFANFNEGSQHLDLDVALVTDQTANAVVVIAGGAGKAGDRLTDNVVLRVTSTATRSAEAKGLRPDAPVIWRGSLGRSIKVTHRGRAGRRAPHGDGAVLDFAPQIL